MYGFAVNLIVSVSGHCWIINEISGPARVNFTYLWNNVESCSMHTQGQFCHIVPINFNTPIHGFQHSE